MKKGQTRKTYTAEFKAEVLEAFETRPRGVYVEHLEKQFDVPKGTVHRFIQEAKKKGPGQGAISSSRALSKVEPLDEAEAFGRTYKALSARPQGDLFNVQDIVAELNPPPPVRSVDKNTAKIARLEKEIEMLKEDLRLLQDIARHSIKRGVLGLLPTEEGR